MNAYFILFALIPSLLLGPEIAQSSPLDSLVRRYSYASLKSNVDFLDTVYGQFRAKRQKGSESSGIVKNDASHNRRSENPDTDLGQHRLPVHQPSEDGGAHCLVRCLRPMINKAPQDAGNETLICPKYDARKIEELCSGYIQAKQCLDECPESPLKNLSMSGFKPLQFMCVDRSEDFKKYMPCLTNVCDEVQRQCEPMCGSLDESVRRLARIQQQVRGPGSRTRGADLDLHEIVQTVADNCQLVGCVGNCSQDSMTRHCGVEAYDLQRDTIWTMLSSMAQAMTSIGLNSVWPPQCQALVSSDQQRHKSDRGHSKEDRGPNSTDRFVEKPIDHTSANTSSVVHAPSPNIRANIESQDTTTLNFGHITSGASASIRAFVTTLIFSYVLFVIM